MTVEEPLLPEPGTDPSGDEDVVYDLTATPARRSGRARRWAAGLFTALLPGLGHLLLGRRRLGALFLLPVAALALLVAGLASGQDRASVAARLLDPGVLAWIIGLQAVLLGWRLVALGSVLHVARPPRYRPLEVLPLALLVVAIAGPQAYLLGVTNTAREVALEVFAASRTTGGVWRPAPPPASPLPGATATPVPTPTPKPLGARTTVLLIGEDSGPARSTSLTDTMIVASLDPVAKTVSLLSIPRDLVDAPIPGGGTFGMKINSLAAIARRNPSLFPGSNGNGEGVLAAVIGELVGIPIDYWAKVNLPGMLRIFETVGGIDVTITRSFCDPLYREYGLRSFGVVPGRWHLDAQQALAYARIRKPAGESDFTRAGRQQDVLIALRDAIVKGGFLGDPNAFLRAIGAAISTNVPPDTLPSVAAYATQIGRENVYRAVISYPLISESSGDPRGWVELPDVPAIRALGAQLFPPAGTMPVVPRIGSGVAYGFVPGATAAPSPAPSRKPGSSSTTGTTAAGSPSPSPSPSPTPRPTPTPPTIPQGGAPDLPRITCTLAPARPSASPRPTPTPAPSASSGDAIAPPSADPAISPSPSPPEPSGEATAGS